MKCLGTARAAVLAYTLLRLFRCATGAAVMIPGMASPPTMPKGHEAVREDSFSAEPNSNRYEDPVTALRTPIIPQFAPSEKVNGGSVTLYIPFCARIGPNDVTPLLNVAVSDREGNFQRFGTDHWYYLEDLCLDCICDQQTGVIRCIGLKLHIARWRRENVPYDGRAYRPPPQDLADWTPLCILHARCVCVGIRISLSLPPPPIPIWGGSAAAPRPVHMHDFGFCYKSTLDPYLPPDNKGNGVMSDKFDLNCMDEWFSGKPLPGQNKPSDE